MSWPSKKPENHRLESAGMGQEDMLDLVSSQEGNSLGCPDRMDCHLDISGICAHDVLWFSQDAWKNKTRVPQKVNGDLQ